MRWSSADEAVEVIRSGQRVFVHGTSAFPTHLVDALVRRAPELRDVELAHLHTYGAAPHVAAELAGHFYHRAFFVGSNVRAAVGSGRATYTPTFLSDVPRLFERGQLPVDVALLHLSPPDAHGYCSLGTSVDVALAGARAARVRVAQINPRMPRTHGNCFLHVDELAHVVAVDEPLPQLPPALPDDAQRAIARRIAGLVPDGATLQVGIGAVPDAVLAELGDHRDLGIHSEVVSDGILDLIEKGVVTGARKAVDPGKVVSSFLTGTQRLYDFVDDNPMVEMHPVDYTNDTRRILQLDNMIAVNSALEIDLTGQVCAESIGPAVYSGVGGQMDFIRGAALSRGGKPIIALPATAKGGTVSRIAPTLSPGAGVTTSRAHVHYVVTEFGVANLHGLDLAERARALIGLADPAFADELTRAARSLALLPPR